MKGRVETDMEHPPANATQQKAPFHKIGLLNLIAITGVVYIHGETYGAFGYGAASWCGVLQREVIGAFEWAVPLFFFLSACLFYLGFSWSALLPKWKRRVKSLVVPYLVWNTVYFALFAILPRIPWLNGFFHTPAATLTGSEIFSGIFLHQYAGHFWFLRILLLFTLCAPLFYLAFSRPWIGELALLGVFLLMVFRPAYPIQIPYFSWRMLFFYSAGAYVALRKPELLGYTPPKAVRIGCILLLPLYALLNAYRDHELYSLFFICLLWLGVDENQVRPRFLFQCSFWIYASHMLALSLMKKGLVLLLPHTEGWATAAYLLIPALVVALLVAADWLLLKCCPKALALLTGGRQGGDADCERNGSIHKDG